MAGQNSRFPNDSQTVHASLLRCIGRPSQWPRLLNHSVSLSNKKMVSPNQNCIIEACCNAARAKLFYPQRSLFLGSRSPPKSFASHSKTALLKLAIFPSSLTCIILMPISGSTLPLVGMTRVERAGGTVIAILLVCSISTRSRLLRIRIVLGGGTSSACVGLAGGASRFIPLGCRALPRLLAGLLVGGAGHCSSLRVLLGPGTKLVTVSAKQLGD